MGVVGGAEVGVSNKLWGRGGAAGPGWTVFRGAEGSRASLKTAAWALLICLTDHVTETCDLTGGIC